ncbi:hypothetical protein FB157_1049 [Streptomyces sp. BK340]|nr:hypothetical protein FB157_1049 [Streptomyces sp. BK340]
MTGAARCDGNLVTVRRQEAAENGEIVDGKATTRSYPFSAVSAAPVPSPSYVRPIRHELGVDNRLHESLSDRCQRDRASTLVCL